jgi:hypothetical protein
MANYGKYYIAVRLLLLKQYLEANAGRTRIVKRRELEDLLAEHDMPVEKKTLYQDFAALGDVCGLQLEYDVHIVKGSVCIHVVSNVLHVVSVVSDRHISNALC